MIWDIDVPDTWYVTTLEPDPKNDAPIAGILGGGVVFGVGDGPAANWVASPFAV